MTYPVIEIFDSIEGEGIRQGLPATFIRLAECNLQCAYCDTTYAQTQKPTSMPLSELLGKVNTAFKRCTITGGEPLMHPQANQLINALTRAAVEVNIETNGSIVIDTESLIHPEQVFFTVDYKLPASGMTNQMRWENFTSLRSVDVIKFVVAGEEDVTEMLRVMRLITNVYEEKRPHVYVGTVFGSYENKKLAEILLQEPLLHQARMQLQIHKLIWNPEERGV